MPMYYVNLTSLPLATRASEITRMDQRNQCIATEFYENSVLVASHLTILSDDISPDTIVPPGCPYHLIEVR